MKKIYCIILFNLCLTFVFSQDYGLLLVKIIDSDKTVISENGQLINNDANLNVVFENFNIFSYKYAQDFGSPEYDPSDYMWYVTGQDGTPWLWHLKNIQADH